jgi:hypothetical protein
MSNRGYQAVVSTRYELRLGSERLSRSEPLRAREGTAQGASGETVLLKRNYAPMWRASLMNDAG